MPRKVSWIPALVLYCIATIISVITDLAGLNDIQDTRLISLIIGLPISVLATIFTCILHYNCWQAVPIKHRRTTPGKAVGYLFIPFFNLYWLFISFPALAKGFSNYAREAKDTEIGDQSNLAIAYAVVTIFSLGFSFINGLASVMLIASLILFIVFYRAMVAYSNRVYAATV
jgi:hypothetical protein